MNWKLITVLSSLLIFSHCGVMETAEQTRDQVKISNTKQDRLIEETEHLADLTNQLIHGMEVTNHGVHLQIMTVALQQMMAPENTAVLVPPARMMPYAETLAMEATPQEIMELVHTFLVDLIKSPKEFEAARLISYTAASAIAAFTPDAKVAQIFKDQIENEGRYEQSAYQFGLLRFLFIKDYMLGSVVATPGLNKGCLVKAREYFDKMKYLVELPYRDKMVLKVADLEMEGSVDLSDYQESADNAVSKFNAQLKPEVLSSTEVKSLLGGFKVH